MPEFVAPIVYPDGAAAGAVLTSDAAGEASWQPSPAGFTEAAHDARDHSVPAGSIALFDLEDVGAVPPVAPPSILAFDSVTQDWGPAPFPAGTVPAGTPGSIAFWNALGTTITEDNPNWFYDDAANRAHIGPRATAGAEAGSLNVYPASSGAVGLSIKQLAGQTADAWQVVDSAGIVRGAFQGFDSKLAIFAQSGLFPELDITRSSSDGLGAAGVVLLASGGTLAAKTAVSAGQEFGAYRFSGHDGVAFGGAARMSAESSEAWVPGAHGSRMLFGTVKTGDAGAIVTRVEITGQGRVNIGDGTGLFDNARLNIHPLAAEPAIEVRQAAMPTEDIIRLEDSAVARLFTFDVNGFPKWPTAKESITVGLAGGAAPLPALPNKYVMIKDAAGTTLKVPAYNS